MLPSHPIVKHDKNIWQYPMFTPTHRIISNVGGRTDWGRTPDIANKYIIGYLCVCMGNWHCHVYIENESSNGTWALFLLFWRYWDIVHDSLGHLQSYVAGPSNIWQICLPEWYSHTHFFFPKMELSKFGYFNPKRKGVDKIMNVSW